MGRDEGSWWGEAKGKARARSVTSGWVVRRGRGYTSATSSSMLALWPRTASPPLHLPSSRLPPPPRPAFGHDFARSAPDVRDSPFSSALSNVSTGAYCLILAEMDDGRKRSRCARKVQRTAGAVVRERRGLDSVELTKKEEEEERDARERPEHVAWVLASSQVGVLGGGGSASGAAVG